MPDGEFDWGGRLRKGIGGAQRFPQNGRKPFEECKGRRELENGVITDYPMGFARYRQVKALEAQNKIDHTPKAVKEKTITEKPKPNRSAQQARRQLTICEKEISAQETAIAEIEQRLEEAGGDYERYSEIYKEKEAAEQKLSELMEKWETLAEQAGE